MALKISLTSERILNLVKKNIALITKINHISLDNDLDNFKNKRKQISLTKQMKRP